MGSFLRTALGLVVLFAIQASARLDYSKLDVSITAERPMAVKVCIGLDEVDEECGLGGERRIHLQGGKTPYAMDFPHGGSFPLTAFVMIETAEDDGKGEARKIRSRVVVAPNLPSVTVAIPDVLDAVVRLSCQEHRYGSTCQQWCKPQEDPALARILGFYTCTQAGMIRCRPGWEGDDCKTRMQCKNGLLTKVGRCHCKNGWTGVHCDQCIPSPGCQHGTCSNDTPGTCACQEGWAGDNCEIDISFCHKTSPCQNGGICTMLSSSNFECRCPTGWTGKFCHISLDATGESVCAQRGLHGDVCHNGGKCIPLDRPGIPFKCDCEHGFAGDKCEVAVCKPGVCGAHGSCRLAHQEHVCDCADGWSGRRCEIPPRGVPIVDESGTNVVFLCLVLMGVFAVAIVVLIVYFARCWLPAYVQKVCGGPVNGSTDEEAAPEKARGLFKVALDHQKNNGTSRGDKEDQFKVVIDSRPSSPRYSSGPSTVSSIFSSSPSSNRHEKTYEEIPSALMTIS